MIADKITLEQVKAEPWKYDSRLWRELHGVHVPWICEISPMQMGMMSKRQGERYQKERTAVWQTSHDSVHEWNLAVIAAHDGGLWDWRESKDASEDAKSVMIHEEIRRDKQALKDRFNWLSKLNAVGESPLVIGDVVWDMTQYRRVIKLNRKSVVCESQHSPDGYKVSRAQLFWLSYNDLQKLAETGAEEIKRKTL